jgi:hypothetical protein
MEKEKFRELCFHYFLDQIREEEYTELKAALDAEDDELKKIFRDTGNIVLHLPFASDFEEPPLSVKKLILKDIRSKKRSADFFEKLSHNLWLDKPGFALAAAALLIAAVVYLSFFVINLDSMVKYQQQRISELESEAEKNRELLNILTSREIEVVIMNGLEINPSGFGKIIWDPERKTAILQISNLPPVEPDKDYQLWVIKDNKPVSAGVFDVEDKTDNFYKIENLAEVDKKLINAFAVTLEPKGGVSQPTGKMYLMGQPSL